MIMWKDIFVKRKYATVKLNEKPEETKVQSIDLEKYDANMFTKCKACGEILINDDLLINLNVCPKCGHHFRLDSKQRIDVTFDYNSAEYFDDDMRSLNPLEYPGYAKKINEQGKSLDLKEGVLTGKAAINGNSVCFGVMDWRFIMGSMGSVVGEKLSRMLERAVELKLPAIIFSVSGGARMQEGMLSLSQMAKVSAAVKRHSNAGLLYISVLTDPTTGGVTASYASLGDIIIAEPGATIGFAGKRVIEQTIRQKLPETFQSAEFLLEHGFVDMIVNRLDMKDTLGLLLELHRR